MEEIHVKHRELAEEIILALQRAGNSFDRQDLEVQLFQSSINEREGLDSVERLNSNRLFFHKMSETIADLEEGEWLKQNISQEYDPNRSKEK